ncbi:MAG: efflux RND transporter permease subunit, partial [bacterium]
GTNIAAFLPLILLPGIMGKFMRIIPLVFALALLASLFEAFFLLPSHYADWTIKSQVQKRGEKKFFKSMRRAYGHLLIKVLRRRYYLLPGLVLVLILSLGLIPLIGVNMFGEEDFDQFNVLVRLPEGTSLEESDRIMRKFEAEALALPNTLVNAVVTNVGLMQGNNEWVTRKNVAQVLVQLVPKEQRTESVDDVLEMMRERVQYISGPASLQFDKITGGPPVGKPISVKVQGKYLDDVKRAALALQDSIRTLEGAYDVSDDFPPGKQEIRIIVDEEKAALYGFSTQYVAMNVRYAFDGVEATEFRDGDDEIDVIVKYDQLNRSTVDDVLNLRLTNAGGQTVAMRDMVRFEITPGPTEIKRFDQKRTIMVTGEIDENETSLDRVNLHLEEIFPKMEALFPGVTFEIGGQFEEFLEVFQNITSLFILSVILIFLILGTQFNSYAQPLVILTTVPFALIGAVLGLLISGNPFSIVAMFGFVALAGIVVNDAIVMIDFMNRRRAGKNTSVFQYWRSIINGGRLRLRPIILTSLTTISGLIPMAFGIGGTSEMWAPLANVILFGLLVSTILTLFVIPSLMAVLDDLKRSRKKATAMGRGIRTNGMLQKVYGERVEV